MTYLTSEEVKQGELEILLVFDKLAKEHDLKYSIDGGTLLGAVRHKGFIPWDDDIDVMMLRPEYDRLIALAREGLDLGPFRFSGYEIDGYPMPFVKMFDTRVRVKEGLMPEGFVEYLWIDVFPIDALPENSRAAERAYSKSFFLRVLINTGNLGLLGGGRHWYKRAARMAIYPFVKLFHLNDWAERKMAVLARSFGETSSSKFVGTFVWGYGMPSRNPAEVFRGTCLLEFEGHEFPAISGWHERLSSLYGDYMQLPPVDERVTHSVTAYLVEEGQSEDGDC